MVCSSGGRAEAEPLSVLQQAPKLTGISCFQALKDSKVVEIVDEKIRRKEQPEKWALPGPPMADYTQTDFSQFINCPEFVPRQSFQKETGDHWGDVEGGVGCSVGTPAGLRP